MKKLLQQIAFLLLAFTALGVQIANACSPAPSTLSYSNPTATSAYVYWVENASATNWQVRYGLSGFPMGTGGTNLYVSGKSSTKIVGLNPSTSYDFYVRSICGANDTSSWSLVGSFSTLCVMPAITHVENDFICGQGAALLEVAATPGSTINWYNNPAGGIPFNTGAIYNTPTLTSTATYYVSAHESGLGNAHRASVTTPYNGGSNCAGGVMFNINAFVDVYVDSIKARAANTTTNSIVRVYTKDDTYLGSETSPTDWVLHATVMIPSTTAGQLFNISLPNTIDVPASKAKAVYLYYDAEFTIINNPQTHFSPDLSLSVGSGLCTEFGSVTANRGFNGTVHYRKIGACESGRTPILAQVAPVPHADLGANRKICVGETLLLDAEHSSHNNATYFWNTTHATSSINIADPGAYIVTVTQSGCTASDTILVAPGIEPYNPFPEEQNLCEGTALVLNAGNIGSKYSWNTGQSFQTISVTTGGYYQVLITSQDDCKLTAFTYVIPRSLPDFDLGDEKQYVCEGASITLDASYADDSTYLWTGTVWGSMQNSSEAIVTLNQPIHGNYYKVFARSKYGCTRTDSVQILYYQKAKFDAINFIPNFYDSIGYIRFEPVNPIGINVYEWDLGDGTMTNEMKPIHKYDSAGSYLIQLKVSNECGEMDRSLLIAVDEFGNITNVVGMDKEKLNVLLYPNPANNKVIIENKNQTELNIKQVKMFDMLGRCVYDELPSDLSKHTINLQEIATGMYMVHLLTDKGTIVKKLTVSK